MADALFRGVYAQILVAAIEWVKLPNEGSLVIEGIEDVDVRTKISSEIGQAEEEVTHIQVKQLDHRVSARTSEVTFAVAQFAHEYLQARRRQVSARFVFTTSAGRARQQTANENAKVVLDVDILKEWASPQARSDKTILAGLWRNLKTLLMGNLQDFGSLSNHLPADIQELDKDGLWEDFVQSVGWEFDHGDIESLFGRLIDLIKCDDRFSEGLETVPPEYFAKEIIVELVRRAGSARINARVLERISLSRLAAHAVLALNVAKSEMLNTYQEHIYLETECLGVRALCLLRVPSVSFVETEVAAFLAALNGSLTEMGYPYVATASELAGRGEVQLNVSAWLRMLPFAVFAGLTLPGDRMRRARVRHNLEVSSSVGLSHIYEMFEDVGFGEAEYSEIDTGAGLVQLGGELNRGVLLLARLVANVLAAKILAKKDGEGAKRLYESIRFKVKLAIDLDSKVFSEPDRPIV